MSSSLFRAYKRLRRRWFYGLISTIVALGLVLGSANPAPAVPWTELIFRGAQVFQLASISDEEEVALGREINEQLVNGQVKIYSNSSINRYVDQVGQRLVPDSDRPNLPYVFQVVEDSQVNAFATLGGFVYVTTGLLQMADNEAQLASVVGHEIGHIAARHSLKQMRQRAIAQGILSAAGLDRSRIVNIGVELAVNRPNSRGDEYEADEKGLANLVRAGYAPGAMVDFMSKLLNQRSVPTVLSTHPATENRIERLNEMINASTAYSGDGLDDASYRSNIQALR
jgi:predicted Zn-dependent protease